MRILSGTSLVVLAALAIGVTTLASAQSKHDSNAPIDFAAAHQELDDRAQRVILTGDVVITQAEMTLKATRVNVAFSGSALNGSPEATRVDAVGGVVMSRPDQRARSDYAIYDVKARTVTMLGNVNLVQGNNNISGGRLTLDLDTGRATVDGGAVGGSLPGTTTGGNGRVTGHFQVPKRDN